MSELNNGKEKSTKVISGVMGNGCPSEGYLSEIIASIEAFENGKELSDGRFMILEKLR